MLKATLFLVLILMQSLAYSASFKARECAKEGDSCSLCNDISMLVTPLVNVDKQIVQLNVTNTATRMDGASTLPSCKVIDKNNWNCKKAAVTSPRERRRADGSVEYLQLTSENGYSMINGQLFYTPATVTFEILKNGLATSELGYVIGPRYCFVRN